MKKLISAIIASGIIFTHSVSLAAFKDVDTTSFSWAEEAIINLAEKNIINGYPDGSFVPNGNVTRAEFAKMLSVAFDASDKKNNYADISGHWAENYINSTDIYTEGSNFNPDEYATRADVAYGVVHVLEKNDAKLSVLDKFSDCESLGGALKNSLANAIDAGIIKGYEDNTVRPLGNVTRAEAAVIIYRAIALKTNDDSSDNKVDSGAEITPPSDEIIEAPAEKPEMGDTDTEKTDDDRHMYSLYPGADLILVSSVSSVSSEESEGMYRISYRLGKSEDEYSSVIPEDIAVTGIRTKIADLRPGDVMIMNTAFHGHIGNLHVLASFGGSTPLFDTSVTSYSKGKYTIKYGKVISYAYTGKTASLVIDNGNGEENVLVLRNTETSIFSNWKKNNKWSLDYIDAVDTEQEDVYVYIRYTNGVSTEVIVSNTVR